MDEKTAALRDLFVEMTDSESVTESQEESPGSLADDVDVEGRLRSLVARMREAFSFDTALDDAALVTVVRAFYAGAADDAIARELDDADAADVAPARLDLHLLREDDCDPPFDFDTFREALDAGTGTAELADRFGVEEVTVRRYRRVLEATRERRRVNDRYREEFENLLLDRELSENMTEDSRRDGLDDATEGQEVDVQF